MVPFRSRHGDREFRMSLTAADVLVVADRLDPPVVVAVVADEHLNGVSVRGLPGSDDIIGHGVLAFGRLRGSGRLAYQARTSARS